MRIIWPKHFVGYYYYNPKVNESVIVVVVLALFADDAKAVWESMDANVLSNGENSMMVNDSIPVSKSFRWGTTSHKHV
jgi:hypothetical protein